MIRSAWNRIDRSPAYLVFIDPNFRRQPSQYIIQAWLAVVGMFAVLVLVDSFSDAALAAGLGSCVLIIFVHPTTKAATPRSLVGGHLQALLVGSVYSLVLFAPPVKAFLEVIPPLRDLIIATSVGILDVIMAIRDTEHPPAAGTVLGMSTRVWDPSIFAIIVGAVVLLAVIKRILRRYLRDLI